MPRTSPRVRGAARRDPQPHRRPSLPIGTPLFSRSPGRRQRHPAASGRLRECAVGIGPFTTQTASHNRGLPCYIRSLVSALGTRPGQQLRSRLRRGPLVRSTSEGRKRGNPPAAARASPRRGEPGPCSTWLITTNPDATDVFLLLELAGVWLRLRSAGENLERAEGRRPIHDLAAFFVPLGILHRPAGAGVP